MVFRVVEKHRRLERFGRSWKPVCPVSGCGLEADHEVRSGPKWVWRGCGTHAYAEADRLNAGLEAEVAAGRWNR